MALYEKPVRLLFKDMVKDMDLRPDQNLEREAVYDWFIKNYPKAKKSTISAHLLKMSVNAPSRVHYNVSQDGEDDLLYQIDSQRYRLFDPNLDPKPIYSKDETIEGIVESEDEGQVDGREFAYESDLQNFLAKNLSIISPDLSLYEDEGITGVEFPVGNRRIDILAVDKNGDYVVIELKVSKGYDRVVGQLLGYIGWIRKNHAEAGQNVRGVIIARNISEDLVLACSMLDNVDLFEYELSIALRKIHPE